jgi:hypothetical protein
MKRAKMGHERGRTALLCKDVGGIKHLLVKRKGVEHVCFRNLEEAKCSKSKFEIIKLKG